MNPAHGHGDAVSKGMVQSPWKGPASSGVTSAPLGSSPQPPPREPAQLCSLSCRVPGMGTRQGLEGQSVPQNHELVSPVEESKAGYG